MERLFRRYYICVFTALCLLISQPVQSANTGDKYPTTSNNGSWGSPENAFSDGGGNATGLPGATQDYKDFNFGIPAGANINGIELDVEAQIHTIIGGGSLSFEFSWDNGASWSDSKSVSYACLLLCFMSEDTRGGSTDTWGHDWNVDELSDANFVLRISTTGLAVGLLTSVDYLRVKIEYTALSATNTTIAISSASIGASGVATSTITVQAKDDTNTNISAGGHSVVLMATGSASISAIIDNNDGTYTATITNTTTESVTISGTINGNAITDTEVVTFTDTNAATLVNSSATLNEGASTTLTVTELNATDIDSVDAALTYTVGNVSNGSLAINSNPWASGTNDNFSPQDITDGGIAYTHDGSNTTTDSFTFSIDDPNNNTLSGQTFTFTINPIDDDVPIVLTNTGTTMNEGGDVVITTTDLSATDTEDLDSSIIYSVSNLVNGSITVGGGAATTFTQQNLIDGIVRYAHNDSETLIGSFDFTIQDSTPNISGISTFTISVNPVDDSEPVIINNTTTTVYGGETKSLTATDLQASDTESADTALIYTVGNVTNGNLNINGNPWTAGTNDSFTQQDIINGTIIYTHDSSNTTIDSFGFSVQDPIGNSLAGQTFSFTVYPLGDYAIITASPTSITADGVSTSTITLQIKDALNNNLIDSGLNISLIENGSATIGSIIDNGDSTYTANVTNTVAEAIIISGTVNGSTIINNATVTFIPGVASASQTTISASKEAVVADGSTTSTITVKIYDAQGNGLTSGGLTIGLTENGSAVISGITDVGDGTYTATITNAAIELITISGTIDGTGITDTASISFLDIAPGGIANNLTLWFNAEVGVTGTTAVSQWDDQSGANNHITQANPTYQPSLNTASSSMNFHPSLELDGDRDFLETSGVLSSTTDDMTYFIVTEVDQSSGSYNKFFGMGSNTDFPHVGFYPSGQLFHYGTDSTFHEFNAAEPMRYNELLIVTGDLTYPGTDAASNAYINGQVNSSTTVAANNQQGTGTFFLGGDDCDSGCGSISDEDIDGRIAEFVLYDRVLTATERQQVESYLALKYGISLNNNYLDSNTIPTTIFSLDGTYENDIAGIAKDFASSLDQRISKSINSSAVLTLSTDTDYSSANDTHANTLANGNFLIFGHDGGSASSTQTANLHAKFDNRIIRQWKIQNTGNVGNVNLSFSTLPALVGGQLYTLIEDADGDFTSGFTTLKTSLTPTFENVTFSPGTNYFTVALLSVSMADTTITPSVVSVVANGTNSATITIQIKDSTGSNITLGGFTLVLADDGNATISPVIDNNDGTYTATITNPSAEIINISGSLAGNAIADIATITFTPDIASTAQTTISVSSAAVTTDGGTTATITVQTVDAFSNPLTFGGSTILLTENGNASISAVTDNGDGTYTATISNTTAEAITISGTLDGSAITDSAVLTFTTGVASTTQTTMSISSASVTTDGGATSTITVQTADAQGNNLTNGGETVALGQSGSANISNVIDNGNGTYSATISNVTAEAITITGTLNGSGVIDVKNIIFVPGAASPTNSIITASPSVVTANGNDISLLTVQVIDAQGNPLNAGGDSIVLIDSNDATISLFIDHLNGTYTATIRNTSVQTTTINGILNSVALVDNEVVEFVEGGPAQVNESDGNFINGTGPIGSTVEIQDAFGNILCSNLPTDPITGEYHCPITEPMSNGDSLTVITTDLAGNSESSETMVQAVDSDDDGISDVIEKLIADNEGASNTQPDTDTDGDGLPDYAEIILGSDFLAIHDPVINGDIDADMDGITDAVEFFFENAGGSSDSETTTDTDGDGIPDITELVSIKSNFNQVHVPIFNGSGDDDADNVTNAVEYYLSTFSFNDIDSMSDYDHDGFSDALEVRLASDPLRATEPDIDMDGINNAIESFLTGSINDGINTALIDRDNDGLPDIFELTLNTDLDNSFDIINAAQDGDADGDGITDAVEIYLSGEITGTSNTTSTTITQDTDNDGITDIIEIAQGSNPLVSSNPVVWIDVDDLGAGSVQLFAQLGGYQSPYPTFSWDVNDILLAEPSAIIPSTTSQTLSISGLSVGQYTASLTLSKSINGQLLSSTTRQFFHVIEAGGQDSDHDGISDAFDAFDGAMGAEENLNTVIGSGGSYQVQAEYGTSVRSGLISRMGGNEIATISPQQLTDYLNQDLPVTAGNTQTNTQITSTPNMFDVDIVNIPSAGGSVDIVIPLNQSLSSSAAVLLFDHNNYNWSFMDTTTDIVRSAIGTPGNCPPLGDASYSSGLIEGANCLLLQVTDGGPNDNDTAINGTIPLLVGIGVSSHLNGNTASNLANAIESITNSQPVIRFEDNQIQFEDSQVEVTSESTDNGSKGGVIDLLSLLFLALLSFSFCRGKREAIVIRLES